MKKNVSNIVQKKETDAKKQKISIIPPSNLPFWATASIFLIITVIFFWNQLAGNSFFWEDIVRYVFPVQSFAAREVANGNIPFWNPYSFNGMPFLADLQVGFFYLLNRVLSAFIDSSGHLPLVALEGLIIFHFIIAQFTMYFLCKYWKISSIAAVISSISYAFSFAMVMRVIHPMMVYHYAWFPLVILFFLKGLKDKEFKFAIICGLIFGMSILSGHPQVTLYEGFFLGLLFLFFFVAAIIKKEIKGIDYLKFVSLGLIPIVVAIGIYSIQFIQSQELASLSKRSEITYELASEGSLQPKQVYTSVVPKLFGYVDGSYKMTVPFNIKYKDSVQNHIYWETAFYFGIVCLILGLFGIWVKYKSREGIFLIFIILFGFLFALGENGFLFRIFFGFPLFNIFRSPARMMFFVMFAFSIFAGFGFDALWKLRNNKKALIWVLLAGVIPGLVALLTATGVLPTMLDSPEQYVKDLMGYGSTSVIFVVLTMAVCLIIYKTKSNPILGGIFLAFMAFIDLYIAGCSFNQSPQNPNEAYKLNPKLKEMLKPKIPNDIFRVNVRIYDQIKYRAMEDNQGMIDEIMLYEGYNQLLLQRHAPPLANSKDNYDLLNIKYQIGIDSVRNSAAFFERNTNFPRAWLVHRYIVMKPDEVESNMKKCNYNYLKEVILEENPTITINDNPADTTKDSVSCIDYKENYFKYSTKSSNSGILCFSEIWYPDWKVYVDGNPANMIRADYCFRAVAIPQGEHVVEMRYESASFHKGIYVASGTLIVSILCLIACSSKKKEKET